MIRESFHFTATIKQFYYHYISVTLPTADVTMGTSVKTTAQNSSLMISSSKDLLSITTQQLLFCTIYQLSLLLFSISIVVIDT